MFAFSNNNNLQPRMLNTSSKGGSLFQKDQMRQQFIDPRQMHEIAYFARMDETIVSVLDILVNNIRSGGVNIYMEIAGSRFEMTPEYRSFFKREWEGRFLENFIRSLYTFGIAVVNFVPSTIKIDELVPNVVSIEHFTIGFAETFRVPRRYYVYENFFASPDAKVRSTMLNKPVRDVLVFEMPQFAPLPTGKLASPIAIVKDKISQMNRMFANQAYADFHRTHPMYTILNEQPEQMPDVLENDRTAEDDLGEAGERHIRRVNVFQKKEWSATVKDAMKKNVVLAKERRTSIPVEMIEDDPAASYPPYLNSIELGIGQNLGNTPKHEILPNMINTAAQIISIVYQVLGIPPQLMNSPHVVYETNAQMSLRLFDNKVKSMQDYIEPIFRQLYQMLYLNTHLAFNAEVIKKNAQRKLNKEEEREKDPESYEKKKASKAAEKKKNKSEKQKDASEDEGTELEYIGAKSSADTSGKVKKVTTLGEKKGKSAQENDKDEGAKSGEKKEPKEKQKEADNTKQSAASSDEARKKQEGDSELPNTDKEKSEKTAEEVGMLNVGKMDEIHAGTASSEKVTEQMAKKRKEDLSKRKKGNGTDRSDESDHEFKKPKKVSVKLMEGTLDIEDIDLNTQVYVEFNRTPLTDLQSVQFLHQEKIISFQTYAKHAISIVGLSQDEIMTDEERNKIKDEELEEAQQHADIETNSKIKQKLATQTPGKGGAGGAAAKKPGISLGSLSFKPKSSSSGGGGSSSKKPGGGSSGGSKSKT